MFKSSENVLEKEITQPNDNYIHIITKPIKKKQKFGVKYQKFVACQRLG